MAGQDVVESALSASSNERISAFFTIIAWRADVRETGEARFYIINLLFTYCRRTRVNRGCLIGEFIRKLFSYFQITPNLWHFQRPDFHVVKLQMLVGVRVFCDEYA